MFENYQDQLSLDLEIFKTLIFMKVIMTFEASC